MTLQDTPISEIEFAAIDFESAGAKRGETDEPIQIGITTGSITDGITDYFESYIKPKKEVMWQSSRIHGIKTKDLQDSPSYLELWPEIQTHLDGKVLIAHATGTEKRYLKSFPGHSFGPWVDSLTVSKAALPEADSHKLERLKPYMHPRFQSLPFLQEKKWHDALYDAAASFCLIEQVVQDLQLEQIPLSVLLQPNTQRYYSYRNQS